MKLITERDVIRQVPARWRKTCEGVKDPSWWGNVQKVEERLFALDTETCTAGDVDAIIGNSSWTHISCDECQIRVTAIVEAGEEPDYESRTVHLCKSCAEKAWRLIETT